MCATCCSLLDIWFCQNHPCPEGQAQDLWLQILAGFESTQEEIPKGEEYEHSEMLLYKVMILEEGGSISEALNQLERSKQDLKDRLGYEETKGRLLLKKGSHQEAEQVYRRVSCFTVFYLGAPDAL